MEADVGHLRETSDPYCRRPAGSVTLMRAAPWRRLVVLGGRPWNHS